MPSHRGGHSSNSFCRPKLRLASRLKVSRSWRQTDRRGRGLRHQGFRRSGRKVIWIIAAAGSRGILETLNLGNNVRYGSLADIGQPIRDVRFTPESRHVQHRNQCLLCAISRHRGRYRARRFEDEAIDDAANRPLLCEVGTDQPVRGLGLALLIGGRSRRSTGLPTPALRCCPELSLSERDERTPPV
jgi:hypothetical protein